MNKSQAMIVGAAVGIMFMAAIVFLSTAEAGQKLGTAGDGVTHAHDDMYNNSKPNHWNNPRNNPRNNPNDGGSVGGCSDNGKWCWNIQIGNGVNNYYPTFPVEVYGNRAHRLIADGRIEYANMNRRGVLFLGVFSRYHNRYFECQVNVPRRQYHCVTAR